MSIGIIIPCRISSSRLPAKAVMTVNGLTVVEYVIDIAKQVPNSDKVIVCTSTNTEDDVLQKIAYKHDTATYRGDLNNVAERFLGAMKEYKLNYAVRLNGDSPLNDPSLIKQAIEIALNEPELDLVTNIMPRTYPVGISVEVIKLSAMEAAVNLMTCDDDKQHITRFLYQNSNLFNIYNITSNNQKLRNYHLAVDTIEDFSLFKKIASKYPALKKNYKRISLNEMIKLTETL